MSDWPKSTATNSTPADGGAFSIEKLKAAMRELDKLAPGDDVIAVSMLFLPDKALEFVDDKGKVYAMGPAMWHRLKAATKHLEPPIGSPMLVPFGGLPVVFEGDDDTWRGVRDRIIRSIEAAEEQSSFMSRLRLELALLRPDKARDALGASEAPE